MKFANFLEQQTHEDRQAFIIHFPALSGKTAFIRKACQVINNIHYLDLLEYVQLTPALAAAGAIDLSSFEQLVLQIDRGLPAEVCAFVVDQGDFMFNTWDREEKQGFLHWLRGGLRTPSLAKRPYIFIIQTDDVLSSGSLINSLNQSRILALNEFEAL